VVIPLHVKRLCFTFLINPYTAFPVAKDAFPLESLRRLRQRDVRDRSHFDLCIIITRVCDHFMAVFVEEILFFLIEHDSVGFLRPFLL